MRVRTLNDRMVPLNPQTLNYWIDEKKKIVDNLRFASCVELLRHDAPLNAKVFGTVEYENFAVEKVIIQTLPGYYLTGNLYRPLDTTKRYPGVLNPHGHWTHGRFEQKDLGRLPQRCANQAMRGMVAFIYDMVGYNDCAQVEHHYFDREEENWNFGRFALQTNNSIKALDFLASLPYVDEDRIACTGCSGGGTQTYFLTALDQRVKIAAPINMASTVMQGGCICENSAFLRTDYNNIDYTMTIAPRPLFMSASDGDWTVLSESCEFPAVQHVYDLYGASKKYEHFYQSAPHCYNLPVRERVYDFLCRNFGITNPYPDEVNIDFSDEEIESFKVGNIADFVPAEGFVSNDKQLFELAVGIIKSNLAKLGESEKADIIKRVFFLDRTCSLDIPYIQLGPNDGASITLGDTPDDNIMSAAEYPSCYNISPDTARVNALTALIKEYPNAKFSASGKSAALLAIAAKIAGRDDLAAAEECSYDIHIPGIALTGLI